MRYFEVEGDSPATILQQFLIQKDISEDYVQMEVLEMGSRGILGIGKKPAKVKIMFDDHEYLKRKAKLYLSDILGKGGFEYHIEVKEHYPDCILNILSDDSNVLIGKSAITLDSLQYLMDRFLRPDDETDIRILVDVDNYRERVIEPLKQKVLRLAKSVKDSGKPAKLPPMATVVRREVHITAKSVPGVSTVSHGDGQLKSLTIMSDRKPRNGKQEREGSSRGRGDGRKFGGRSKRDDKRD